MSDTVTILIWTATSIYVMYRWFRFVENIYRGV